MNPIKNICGMAVLMTLPYLTSVAQTNTFPSSGNVGIGTMSPASKVHIEGTGSTQMRFNRTGVSGEYGFEQGDNTFGLYDYKNAAYRVRSFGNNVLLNEASGNVLVGKSSQVNPLYKLDINGFVRADEIRVNTSGADFVFEDDYRLRTLSETENFIKQYKHLPDIAPARQMANEGIDLGEMNVKLLQKIEELTLYLIDKDKQVNDLLERVEKLEGK